jgi:DEAD/DEAH box helicase domain-containing protein
MYAMCDRQDIGGIVNSSNFGTPAVFLYDRYPGGIGYAEKAYLDVEQLLKSSFELVIGCTCTDGCPSCVGLPVLLPPLQQDPDLWNGRLIPDKKMAIRILEDMLQ